MFWIHPIGFIHASLGWYDLIGGYQPTSDGNLDISPSNILAKAIKIIDAPFVLRHSLHLLLKQPTAYQPSVNFHEFHLSWWNRYFHGIPAATFSATAPLQEDLEELRARGRRGRLQAETSKLEGGKVEVMGHLKRLLIVSFLHCLLKDFRRAAVKYITIYIYYITDVSCSFLLGVEEHIFQKEFSFLVSELSAWCWEGINLGDWSRLPPATLVWNKGYSLHAWLVICQYDPWNPENGDPTVQNQAGDGWQVRAHHFIPFPFINAHAHPSRLSMNRNWSKWSFETNVSHGRYAIFYFSIQCLRIHSVGIAHVLAYVILSHHISMVNLW